MKKFFAFIAIILLFCCFSALTACNIETDKLSAPFNLRFEKGKQEIVWDEVPFATGGYIVRINDVDKLVGKDYWYSISNLDTGTYTISVRALTIDNTYFEDSDWSEPYIHNVRKESGVTYKLINNGAECEVESIGEASGVVYIFDTNMDGVPITRIGVRAFADTSAITKVILGENITSIGSYAFANCSNLSSIQLPAGLLTIDNYAFQACRKITEMELPDSLLSIGDAAFLDCSSLKFIAIPDNIQYISTSMFSQCSSLTDVSIGKGVREINKHAFLNCRSLFNFTVPGNVEIIKESAFLYSGIYNLTLEEGVTYIDQYVFRYAENLKFISIPSTVEKIGSYAFYGTRLWIEPSDYADSENPHMIYADNWLVGCTDTTVQKVRVKENTVGIGDYCFAQFANLDDIEIPNTILHVGTYAFYETKIWEDSTTDIVTIGTPTVGDIDGFVWVVGVKNIDLTSAVFPLGTVGVASHTFVACQRLTSINNVSKLITIGEYAFYQCVALSFNLPPTLKYIGDYAFYNNKSRTLATIPEGVKRIGDYAFYNNTVLNNVEFPRTLKSIGKNSFRFTRLQNINLPSELTYIGDGAFSIIRESSGLPLMNEIIVPVGVKYIGEETFAWSTNISKITLKGVTYIGYRAFYRAFNLETIDLNDGLIYIDSDAFSSVGLTSVYIPDSVVHLGDMAFAGEYDRWEMFLTDVRLSKNITRIGRFAFYLCRELVKINIPSGVRSISDYAFLECNKLQSVTIGKNVRGMGKSVFFGCNLLSIYCESSIKPTGWSEFWNSRDYITPEDSKILIDYYIPPGLRPKDHTMCPIVWGCVLSEDKSFVVSVLRHEYTLYNYNKVNMRAPTKEGQEFLGWTLVEGSDRVDYTVSTFQQDFGLGGPEIGIELFAVWK